MNRQPPMALRHGGPSCRLALGGVGNPAFKGGPTLWRLFDVWVDVADCSPRW